MAIVLVFEEDVLSLICEYALKSGYNLEARQCFYDELGGKFVKIVTGCWYGCALC